MIRAIAIALSVTAIAAGCGSGGTEAAADGAPTSPIAEFLGTEDFFTDDEAASARLAEDERERQQTIAACMQEQGFEYIPVDPGQYNFFGSDDGLAFGSEEWTAKYGFGTTTLYFTQEEVGPDLVGFDDSGSREALENDPNQAIVEAMSESEQMAYYEALYGEQDFFGGGDDTLSEEEQAQADDVGFELDGCQGEAYDDDNLSRFYQDFESELEELYTRIEADPRIAEAISKVSECVSERGFELAGELDDEISRFESEVMAIDEEAGYPGSDLTEEQVSELSNEEFDATFNQPRQLSDQARTKLAQLQEEEVALAVAVQECGGGFDDQQALFAEVQAEYEQDFLDDNADRLADYGQS